MEMATAAVAAGHPETARVAVEVLAAGGSAADAAVAGVLASCAAETILTGLGGAGFGTYFEATTGRVTCLDFFCALPGLDRDTAPGPMRPIEVVFGDLPLPYQIGGASVGVPGVPAGCGELHRRWGRMPWPELVAPAIELARSGVPLPDAHATTLPAVAAALVLGPGAAVYAPAGRLLRGGDLLYHRGLATALETLASDGPAAFYTGAVAEAMVATVRAEGGALGRRDLADYAVRALPVAAASLAGRRVLGRDDLNRTVATIGALPSDLKPPARSVALAGLLGGPAGHGETTNLSVIDAAGNACAVTTTLGVGAAVWLPELGVHLNSMLGEPELWAGTDPAPGSRIASMMCPLVALDRSGRVELVAGSAGASRIRSALIQTLLGALVDDLDLATAIARPRFHATGGLLHAEPGVPGAELAALAAAGYRIVQWDEASVYFGGVSAVGPAGAAGDPRRGGLGLRVRTP
jgi:gamma-glutamyltranspeptidase/glutathione hydrolase